MAGIPPACGLRNRNRPLGAPCRPVSGEVLTMGLDFTACRKLRRALGVTRNGDGEWIRGDTYAEDVISLHLNDPVFAARASDLDLAAPYTGEVLGNEPRWGYGSYNCLRDMLAEFAGYPAVEHTTRLGLAGVRHDAGAWAATAGPFWELINFTDCDGTLGPAVCSKLRDDFRAHKARAETHPDERFRRFYNEMAAMFEWAGDGDGAIVFC